MTCWSWRRSCSRDRTTGPDATTFAAIGLIFGHNLDNEPLPDGRYGMVNAPMTWHFTVDGPKHVVAALDNRTRRSYVAEIGPPGNVAPEALVDQLPRPPLPAGREVLVVIAPLQVIGPPVIDEVVAKAIYRIFDLVDSELTDPAAVAGKRRMPGTNPDALETWAFDPITFEHLLARLAEHPRVVVLSGDVHNAASNVMSYWRGNADHPARIAQFTSSGFKNVMPVYLRALDRSAMLLQELVRARLGVERLAWTRPDSDLVLLPDGQTEADLVAATRARLLRSPVLLATHGWPDGSSRLNDLKPPDWRWKVTPLIDDRPDAERPAPIRALPLDDAAIEAQLADPATAFPAMRAVAARHQAALDRMRNTRQIMFRSNFGICRFEQDGDVVTAVNEVYTSAVDPETQLPVLGPYMVHRASLGPEPEEPPAELRQAVLSRVPDPGAGAVSAGSVLRGIADEVVDFVTFVADLLGRPEARSAVLADLGAAPDATTKKLVLPEAPLAAITAYRAQVDPDLQADVEALGNLALLIGAVIDQIESWEGTDWAGRGDTFVNSLLDLLGSTYVRRRWPKLFLVMQAMSITSELTASLAPGERAHDRFLQGFGTIFSFVWNPGRTLDDLDDTQPGAEGSTLNTIRDTSFLVVDGLIRGIVAAIAVADQTQGRGRPERARGRDRRLGRRRARRGLAGAPDRGGRPVGPDGLARAAARRRHRRRAAPGHLDVPAPASGHPRPAAPAVPRARRHPHAGRGAQPRGRQPDVALPGRDPQRRGCRAAHRRRGGRAGQRRRRDLRRVDRLERRPRRDGDQLRPAARDRDPARARGDRRGAHAQRHGGAGPLPARPLRPGDRLGGQGQLPAQAPGRPARPEGVLPGPGVRRHARVHPRGARRVVRRRDGARAAVRLLGSGRAAHRGDDPAAGRRRAAGDQRPRGGAAAGGGARPTSRRPAGRWRSARWSRSARRSGRVYLRVDRLGLFASMDTMTPSEDRNLRLVEAHVDATRPTGIALDLRTGPVSGGGTIQFDPATGDYVGALVLRVGKRSPSRASGSRPRRTARATTSRRSSSSAPSSTSASARASSRSTGSGCSTPPTAPWTSPRSAPPCPPASSSTSSSRPTPSSTCRSWSRPCGRSSPPGRAPTSTASW